MNEKETNIFLRQKVRTELKLFRKKLLSWSQREVLDHACEYAVKSDLVMLICKSEFSEDHARILLSKPKLLDLLFKEYCNHSSNSMDALAHFVIDIAEQLAEAGQCRCKVR